MNRYSILLTFFVLGGLACVGCKRTVAALETAEYQSPAMRQARASEQAGDMDKAIAGYHEALMRSPGTGAAHLQLALIHHDHTQDYIAAIYHYRRYLALRPDADKVKMITSRIQKAEQLLAVQSVRRIASNDPTGQVALMQQVEKLNASLARAEAEKTRLMETNAALSRQIVDLNGRIKRLELWVDRLQTSPATGGERNAGRRLMTQAAGTTAGQAASRTYEVREGDSLSRIADFVYGDPTLWPRIRDANREKVNNGERVRVGDILVIP